MVRKWRGIKLKASVTIEASVIVPLVLLLVAAVLTVVFSLHDRVIISTVSTYEIMERAAGYEEAPGAVTAEITEMLEKRLIAAKEVFISEEEGADGFQIGIDAKAEAPLAMVRDLISSEDGIHAKINVSNLSGRRRLIKYKTICDGLSAITNEPDGS